MKKIIYLLPFIILFTSCSSDETLVETPEPEIVLKVPIMKTSEAQELSVYSVKLGGVIINEGDSDIIETGLVAGYTSNPTIQSNLNKFILNPNNRGGFELKLQLTGVEENKEIFIRSYGINSQGIGYGNEIKFTTSKNKSFLGQDLVLSTQEEVIAFGANEYNTVSRIKITGTVTDLTPLKDLKVVDETFEIVNTIDLKNLKGLENLIATGVILANGFIIKNNNSLINLEGLSSLETTRGPFHVLNNKNLINLNGLNKFYAVSAGSLRIQNCENLNDLGGLDNLEFIGENLHIVNNFKLKDISALSKINFFLGSINIEENNSLTNLNGLESIKNINFLYLNSNPSLSNIDAIKDCESLTWIKISGNISLINLPLFEKIKIIDVIEIQNSSLESISGLNNLKQINYRFQATHNSSLSDYCSLSKAFENYTGSYEVSSNKYNPTQADLKSGNCN